MTPYIAKKNLETGRVRRFLFDVTLYFAHFARARETMVDTCSFTPPNTKRRTHQLVLI